MNDTLKPPVEAGISRPPTLKARIFVVGYGHSGTSLLLKVLSKHSQISGASGETKYFEFLPGLKRKYPNLDDAARRELTRYIRTLLRWTRGLQPACVLFGGELGRDPISEEELERIFKATGSATNHGELFREVFDYIATSEGKSAWLEKTPAHVFHSDDIVAAIPDALFIEIVRDPRDVLASKKLRASSVTTTDRYSYNVRPRKRLEKAYDPFWDSLSWKAAVRAGASGSLRSKERWYRVHYEHLASEPEQCVREICRFLGVGFEPAMLRVDRGNTAEADRTRTGDGIGSESVGRWQRGLLAAEVALCQGLVAAEMRQLGYEPAIPKFFARLGVPSLMARAGLEFGDRVIRRWRMFGGRFAFAVTANYFRRARHLAAGSTLVSCRNRLSRVPVLNDEYNPPGTPHLGWSVILRRARRLRRQASLYVAANSVARHQSHDARTGSR
jgi:hypothetical protein